MENYRLCFIEYLQKLGLHTSEVESLFDVYATELMLANHFINLFSRQMKVDELWLRHFIDSVSIFEVYRDWAGKNVLDFGCGGGIPGIPIKIVEPTCQLTLLDATKKKIETVRTILQDIKIAGVECLPHRIESKEMEAYAGQFDIIVCRGIKILPLYCKPFENLLKEGGKVFLYKANVTEEDIRCYPPKPLPRGRTPEDLSIFKDIKIHNIEMNLLGERKIVEINYG